MIPVQAGYGATQALQISTSQVFGLIAELATFGVAIVIAHALDTFLRLWMANRCGVFAHATGVWQLQTLFSQVHPALTSAIGAVEVSQHTGGSSSATRLVASTDLRAASSLTIRSIAAFRGQWKADIHQVHNLVSSASCTALSFTLRYTDFLVGVPCLDTSVPRSAQEVLFTGSRTVQEA